MSSRFSYLFFYLLFFVILDYIATSFTDGFSGDERPPSFLALSSISFQIYELLLNLLMICDNFYI